MCTLQAHSGRKKREARERQRRKEKERRLRHTFRESLCELSRWKAEIYGLALCASGVCTCKRSSQGRVLASTYLRTSVPRKHLLKPTSFQTPCVHFYADRCLFRIGKDDPVKQWFAHSGYRMELALIRRPFSVAVIMNVQLISNIPRQNSNTSMQRHFISKSTK